MKLRKTAWNKRYTYTYVFSNGERVTLRPDRDGVTEAEIKALHLSDDAEVRNNIKNAKRPYIGQEKAQWKEWLEKHPDDVELKNWHLSLDSLVSSVTGVPTMDRFASYKDVSTTMPYDEEEADCMVRLREILEDATERQRQVYQLVTMEGYNYTEAGRILGISDVAARRHFMALTAKIRDDEKMKKCFH